MTAGKQRSKIHGAGLGYRSKYCKQLLTTNTKLPWLEILVENHLFCDGIPRTELDLVASKFPLTFHSVGLSLGSTAPLNRNYLKMIKAAIREYRPAWYSEHLAWTNAHGVHFHDLLPMPFTADGVKHVAKRITQVQDFLGQRILVENVSSYITFQGTELSEGEFVSAVVAEADCDLLLDVNNVYVNAINHGFDALTMLHALPKHRIRELHLGGHEQRDGYLLDSHAAPVAAQVWELYRRCLSALGPVPTLIEWDNSLPSWQRLKAEQRKAAKLMSGYEIKKAA